MAITIMIKQIYAFIVAYFTTSYVLKRKETVRTWSDPFPNATNNK